MLRKTAILLAAFYALLDQSPVAAKPLVCPEHPVASSSSQVPELAAIVKSGDALDNVTQLNAAVATLRARGVSPAIIIDNLISAYCPVVAGNASLTDQQKTAKVRRFASQIVRVVYALDSAEEVILDVPFRPDVVNAINAKASAARVSPEEWVANAISSDLKAAR